MNQPKKRTPAEQMADDDAPLTVEEVEAHNRAIRERANDPTIPEKDRVYHTDQPAGTCPTCSAKMQREVPMVVYKTNGPVAYIKCSENCGRTVSITRGFYPSLRSQQHSVAARPDMDR